MKRVKKINYEKVIYRRGIVLFWFILILFSIVLGRIFYVMVINNEKYNELLGELSYNTVLGDSTPRGRILDRNYKVIVDNEAINTIIYKRDASTSTKEMIELAYTVSKRLDLDYYKITDRAKREFYLYKYTSKCDKLISKDEYELYSMKKLSSLDLEELKIERISEKELDKFSDEDLRAAYLFYLMSQSLFIKHPN